MASIRNPKTGKILVIPEQYDETGKDLKLQEALDKGYSQVQLIMSPDAKQTKAIPFNSQKIQEARDKGWKIPEEFIAPEKATGTTEGSIARHELEAIASKNGVPFERLDSMVEYVGANPNYRDINRGKASTGTLSRVLLGNIPQFIYREMQSPQEQQAISDLQELANQRSSTIKKTAEIVGGTALPLGGQGAVAARLPASLSKGARNLTAGVSTGAATGAVFAAANSAEGQEVESAIIGAGIGGVLGSFGGSNKRLVATPEDVANISRDIQEQTGKTIIAHIKQSREAHKAVIDVRTRHLVTGQSVSPDDLTVMGEYAANKPALQRLFSVDPKVKLTPDVKQAMGAIDLDATSVRLAKELGWGGGTSFKVGRYYRKPEKYAKSVQQAKEYLKEVRGQAEGPAKVQAAFDRMTDVAITRNLMKTSFKGKDAEAFWQLKALGEAVVDGKYVARGIDRRVGSNLEGELMRMDDATNRLTFILGEADAELKKLGKRAKAVGLDDNDLRQVVETKSARTPEQMEVIGEINNFFEKHRQILGEMNYSIKKKENYFPHIMPDTTEVISRLRRRIGAATEKVGFNFLDSKIGTATPELARAYNLLKQQDPDLIRAVELLNQRKAADAADFLLLARRATVPGGPVQGSRFTDASAAHLREDAIPEFLLTNGLRTSGLNWVRETYRHVMLKDSINEINRVRDILAASKDQRGARYLTNMLGDITGMRPGTFATIMRGGAVGIRTWADGLVDTAVRNPTYTNRAIGAFGDLVKQVQEVWPATLNMAYPNFLGLSPRALLMNMSQIPTMTVPELGPKLGGRYFSKAAGEILRDSTKGYELTLRNPSLARQMNLKVGDVIKTKDVSLYLKNEGMLAQPWTQDLIDAMHSDIKKSLPAEAYTSIANSYSSAAMFFFSKTEEMNRVLTAKMGRELAVDLLNKDADALSWLQTVASIGGKKTIMELVEKGDGAALTRYVQDYLISKTILNYTRQSMSEFGRFMGPMFSMFTKWPTTVLGEVVEQYAVNGFKKGSGELAIRYLAPWVGLAGTGAILAHGAEQLGQEERLKGLTGSKGIEGWAPVTSLEALLGGEFLRSPAADVAGAVGKVVMNPTDGEKVIEAVNDGLMTFAPLMGILRFWAQDVPRVLKNEEVKSFKPLQFLLGIEPEKEEK